ncbi:hypothetical protein [Conexibacter sp. CPCC 206217]|uniref:hypothetical protein n=1 Tax=Conexibacter sp. CPCC 206217 TaxID=3064574 RepID=UPI002724A402|nr:hypothetical protein [Conexibacter sp. CPCC 206217]MDO8213587.1 hypothetical protein [Conexibacter sp. CPCC 206217]
MTSRFRLLAVLIGLVTVGPALAIAGSPALAAAGPELTVASGNTAPDGSGFPWQVRARRDAIGGIPSLCLVADHSWDPGGQSFGNASTACMAGRSADGFTLHAVTCRGIFVALARASAGDRTIRKVAFAVDRGARSIQLAFAGGERMTLRTHAAPKALRLPVRLAWLVDGGEAYPTRATSYGRKGSKRRAVLGKWTTRTRC